MSDPIDDLYQVASDDEAGTLDALRLRAGHIWECNCSNWFNPSKASNCEECGQPRT